MAVTSAGELYGYDAPGAGETVEIPIVLTDTAGAVVTGVTFDAAGMAVWYSKPGDTNYTAFPTFATENWRELLLGLGGDPSGEYRLIIRQSDAAELALLDTPGMMTFYVKCTATAGDRAIIKVNAADVARDDEWTDARATKIDAVTEARLAELDAANLPSDIDTIAGDVANIDGDPMRGTDSAYTGTPPTAQAIATYVWVTNATGAAVAATLAGITSLAAWLRGLARKSAMNATAKTELNSGGGTYDEAEDSNEAIRDRGDAAWITATGFSTLDPTDILNEVNLALNAAITGSPTADSINERIKALDDLLQADGNGDAAAVKAVTDELAGAATDGVFSAEALANAPTGAAGSGAHTVTGTVADGATVFEGVRVAASNALGTLGPYVQYTDVNGEVEFSLDDDDWRFTAGANGAQGGGYEDVTITADDTFTIAVTAAAIPEPAPDGYCTVWCLAGTEGPDATTGTFYVSEIFSPEVYDPDGTPVEIVRGGTSMALVDGAAYRQVRQNAVVTFVLATPGKQKEWTRVVIPETAEAYVQNLVAEE